MTKGGVTAMKKVLPVGLRATAFHEAGHAVACIYERVALSTVSIAHAKDTAGRVIYRHLLSRSHIDCDRSTRNRLRMEHMVRMLLAGPAAQRRSSPPSIRHYHGEDDFKKAIDLVTHFTESEEECSAYIRLLEVQTQCFLNRPGVWDQITALATALLVETTITSQRTRSIVDVGMQRFLEVGKIRE